MNTNIIHLQTRRVPNQTGTAQDADRSIYRIVKAFIHRQRLAATRRMTRQLLQNLPTIIRRDVGIADVRTIKNNELTHQFYSLD